MKEKIKQIGRKILVVFSTIIFISSYIGVVILIGTTFGDVVLSFNGFDSEYIMHCKEHFYELNNEGIKGCKYYFDDITIQTPNVDDKVIVFNDGLKYVEYPDLLTLYLNTDYSETEVKNRIYKVKKSSYRYLEITVDREHVSNIYYYEYQKKIDYKKILFDICLFGVLILVGYVFIFFTEQLLIKIQEYKEVNNKQLNNDAQESSDKDEISEDENVSDEE